MCANDHRAKIVFKDNQVRGAVWDVCREQFEDNVDAVASAAQANVPDAKIISKTYMNKGGFFSGIVTIASPIGVQLELETGALTRAATSKGLNLNGGF